MLGYWGGGGEGSSLWGCMSVAQQSPIWGSQEQFFRSSGYGMVWGNNFNLFQGMLTVGYADGTTYYILHRLLLLLQCTFRVHTGRLGFLDRSTWFDPLLAPMVQNADWPTELPPAGGFGRFGCHPSVTRNACFAKPSGLDRTGSPEAWLEMATESTVTNLKPWEDLFFFWCPAPGFASAYFICIDPIRMLTMCARELLRRPGCSVRELYPFSDSVMRLRWRW